MQNDYNNQNKNIDLSNALDSAIEQKKQTAYTHTIEKESKYKKKKKLYLIIIIISWIIIFAVVFFTMASNAKRKKQVEKVRQDIQLRIQQNANIQN